MKSKTKELKEELRIINDIADKISFLKDKFKGEECYILTAGPSVREYEPDYIRQKLKDKLVISVKQTYSIAPDIVDFHLLNPFNYQPYDYSKNSPIVVMCQTKGHELRTPKSNEDLKLHIDGKNLSKKNSIAETLDFESYLFENTIDRPFGPGIIYELGIYIALLLGVKDINIIGWDLGTPKSDKISRFYEKKEGFFDNFRNKIYKLSPSIYNVFVLRVINRLNVLKYYLGIDKTVVFNKPTITKNEAVFIANSTAPLYNWLQSKGVKLNVISSISMVSDSVPRRKL